MTILRDGPPPGAMSGGAPTPGPRRRATPWLAGVALLPVGVLVTGVLAATMLGGATTTSAELPPAGEAQRAGTATLPDRFAPYSFRTGPATRAPGGRAIAAYISGHEDKWRLTVAGADRNTYRTIDYGSDYADWALAPDGTRIAVADDQLTVTDLRTGAQYTDLAPEGSIAGWSRDDRLLMTSRNTVWTYDLHSRAETEISRSATVSVASNPAAFSPAGDRIAVNEEDGRIGVYGRTGHLVRRLERPAGVALMDGAAWSPDGRSLLVRGESTRYCVLDVTGAAQPLCRSTRADYAPGTLAGWTGAHTAVVLDTMAGALREVDVRTGRDRILSRFGDQWDGVFQVALATTLTPDAKTRPGRDPDLGPWPWWLTGTVAAIGTMLAVAITIPAGWLLTRARRRRRTPAI